jgi:hypothetical protein
MPSIGSNELGARTHVGHGRVGSAPRTAAGGLVRAGFGAKGVLYVVMAVIALRVALAGGGETEDQHGALQTLRDEPGGLALLIALAIGLTGYALWGLVEAARGSRQDNGAKQAFERVGALVRVVAYGALAAFAVSLVVGEAHSADTTSSSRDATANALELPLGRWLVVAVGAIIIGVAGYDLYRSVTQSFLDDLSVDGAARRWAAVLGSSGHAARAVAYGLVGLFTVKAAVEYDPEETVGLDGALQRLAAESYGTVLLGLVAAGLLAYGVYALFEARYHRLD